MAKRFLYHSTFSSITAGFSGSAFSAVFTGSDAAGCLFTAVAVLSVVTVLVVSIFFAGCAAAFWSMAATVFGSDGVVVFCAEGVVEAAATATSLTGDACLVSVAGFFASSFLGGVPVVFTARFAGFSFIRLFFSNARYSSRLKMDFIFPKLSSEMATCITFSESIRAVSDWSVFSVF